MKKNQSKYFNTAILMNNALIELLEKKDLEFITITEITKKAGVNRSTFYLHYDNIYELLEETITNLNKKFVNTFNANFLPKIQSKDTANLITEKFLIPYLNFCKENKRILKLIHKKPTIFQKDKVYKQMYDSVFYPAISQFLTNEEEKIYKLEFFTQGVVGIIYKWMELNCITEIDKLISIIKNCIVFN